MKRDLKISLVHVVELGSDESLSVALCQAFRLKLLDFLKLHDEVHFHSKFIMYLRYVLLVRMTYCKFCKFLFLQLANSFVL